MADYLLSLWHVRLVSLYPYVPLGRGAVASSPTIPFYHKEVPMETITIPPFPYKTVTQAAQSLDLSPSRVYELVKEKRIPHYKAGRSYLLHETDIERLRKPKP